MTDALARLRAAGVSVWLDDLSWDRLTSGSLAALVRDEHVSGVTTNQAIFPRSIADSNASTEQLHDLRVRQAAPAGDRLRGAGWDARLARWMTALLWEYSGVPAQI